MGAIGTVTIVEETYGSVKQVTFSWIGGTAETALTGGTTTKFYSGRLLFLITNPGMSDAPADDYDITILDKNDVDVLGGTGADRDTANTEYVLEVALGAVANSQLELTVQNSGSSGTANGVVTLLIR